jgi:hypothetical protein
VLGIIELFTAALNKKFSLGLFDGTCGIPRYLPK